MGGNNWDDLRILLALSRKKTFSATAAYLKINESTVSRRLNQAEKWLKTSIFDKTPTGLKLTPAGSTMMQHLERAELEIESGVHGASTVSQQVAGSVRITSVPIIVNHVLVPALPKLLEKYPRLEIELIADPSNLSLMQREADIALRLARPRSDMRAISQCLGRLQYAVYANRDVASNTALSRLPWITYENSMVELPQTKWTKLQILKDSQSATPISVNDAEALLQCIKNGIGKALIPVPIGDRGANLVRLQQDDNLPVREIWMLVHPGLRSLPRVQVSIDWMKSCVRRLLSGDD